MDDERRERLQLKLRINRQKLFRRDYLAELPERLGSYLETRPYLLSPQFDEFASCFNIWPQGLALGEDRGCDRRFFQPASYVYRDFGWKHKLMAAVAAMSDEYDDEAALFYPFDGPLYEVPFGWVRRHFVELFECESGVFDYGRRERYRPESVGVVTVDRRVGLVVTHYGGYFESDPNPEETIYELGTWGMEEA